MTIDASLVCPGAIVVVITITAIVAATVVVVVIMIGRTNVHASPRNLDGNLGDSGVVP
jgi:hypothetical protein